MKLIEHVKESDVFLCKCTERKLFGSMTGLGFHRIEFSSAEIMSIYKHLHSDSQVKVDEVKCLFEQLVTRILPPMPEIEELTDE
jgi:hypothetical protein